jgi:hypothetical protein
MAGDYTVFFTVRRFIPRLDELDDTRAIIAKTVNVNVEEGTTALAMSIHLSKTDTDIAGLNYYYDVKIEDPNAILTSVANGRLLINDDITRRI